MPRLSRLKLIINCQLLIVLLSSLFTLALASPAPSQAQLDPRKACFNPEPAYIKDINGDYVFDADGKKKENLTDNYITDEVGDPPGPEGNTNIEALKFTFVYSGPVNHAPGDLGSGTKPLTKDMVFTADFSKLQAIFGAPTSDYVEGRYQDSKPDGHAQANLLSLLNPRLIQKHQGPIGKTNPTAVTDDLRQKYVKYVAETKPDLAESDMQFSDYNGANKKKISELVSAYGLPTPPSPSADRTDWISKWGKYWENIPTTYNEFYIGKLEFRPVHGTTAIQAMKRGDPDKCFPNKAVRTVEFPVPNFFRSAATSGTLNLAMLPKSAWSDQNDLLHVQGAVLGIKTSASDFIKNCFKFASNNPLTNMVKKVIKVSMQKLDEQYSVYAWGIDNATVSGTSATITFSPAANGNFAVIAKNNDTGRVFDSGAIPSGRTSWRFNNLTPGNYRAVLVFGISEISNSVNFNIASPPPSSWTLNNPTITGTSAAFTFSPAANGNFGLVARNNDTGDVFDSGAIASGSSWTFTGLTPGNYRAVLIFGLSEISNAVNFNIASAPVSWTLYAPTVANKIAHFTFSPAANGNFALIVTRPDGTVAVDSRNIPSGQTSWDWSYTEAGDFKAVLVAFGIAKVSNEVSFTIKWHITDPPLITRNADNTVSVKFDFWPPANGTFPLIITNDADGSVGFNSGDLPSGATTFTWNDARWGDWTAKLVYVFTQVSDNEVKFSINYNLNIPVVAGRNVTFTWSPPLHIGTGMTIIVRKTDGTLAWDSNKGGLPIDSTTTKWEFAMPGDYEACLMYLGTFYLEDDHSLICKSFSVSFLYNWTVFDLSDKSCIKVGKEGKAGNAPFCAIYQDKFETKAARLAAGQPLEPNILPGECSEPSKSIFKLNDQTNVVCNLRFTWTSSDYDHDPDPTKPLVVPETGNGNWDFCDPESGGFRTCFLTVGVWPDFRVPYLGQVWNNSLFSDTNEYLPTRQTTGQPGVYSLFTPRVLYEAYFPTQYQTALKLLKACYPNWPESTGGDPNACTELDKIGSIIPCKVDQTIEELAQCVGGKFGKNLPGEVSTSGLGVNTGGGNVLGSNAGNQKERLIGAVDCGKHFSRDVALKPKVLQDSLGIKQDCNLTASALPPGVTPPVEPPITPPEPPKPGVNTCPLTFNPPDGYVLDNPLGLNFGDPDCSFSKSKLYDELTTIDPTNADYWFYTVAPCESTYNPNAYNGAADVPDPAGAWGLFQMGRGKNGVYDHGDVIWSLQTSNAVNYNNALSAADKWGYWWCARDRW